MAATPRLVRANGLLWQQVLADLRERLARGDFSGDFPGELDLVDQYGVSRHTVRQALRELRAEGVVTAARGRRPQVGPQARLIAQPACILHSLFASARARGLTPSAQVRHLEVRADDDAASRLGLAAATPLVHLELLRSIDGEPVARDRIWLPAALAEPLLTADLGRARFHTELHEHTGVLVTGGEETVQAVLPSPDEHEILGMATPTPALSVHRLGTSHGRPVEWRHMLIRADRITLSSTLGPPCGPSTDGAQPLRMTPSLS
ncbi:GntR family transcriptional regulator [Blastococcus jejuensis]|uniref:GntR family transcriptional regulator n=1 Tax=Blastococcus jejuensis TaxID=351224 RepID=A0ABP6NW12_9ACTN